MSCIYVCVMSLKTHDNCIECSKIVRNCHKDLRCKSCNGYIHKKCTKMKPKLLNVLNTKDWICQNCSKNEQKDSNSDIENNVNELN